MSEKNHKTLKIEVFAKVNLSLRILGRLEGGYHSLETIFQNISLSDKLTINSTPGKILVHCDAPGVPEDEENTAYKAAALCLKRLGIRDRGVEIRIDKGIPTRAGLGGGSADAAGAIIACEHLFGPLPGGDSTRYALAASVGADVPFMLCGGRALAWGIGERMLRLPVKKKTPLIVVIPHIPVSTSWAYRALDNAQAEGDNTETMELNGGPLRWEEIVGSLGPVDTMVNDFEPVVYAHHPELREVKETLHDSGATAALLSGSGSGIYGLFSSIKKRNSALKKLSSIQDEFRVVSADFTDQAYCMLD
jgi:4-diphosphocytidyl-2-C-methyl-D-erythritol kinase